MTGVEVLDADLRYNLRPWAVQKGQNPITVEKAEGIFFWDYAGKRYFDMSSQLVNSNLGHNNSEINAGIKAQVDRFSYLAPAHAVESRSQLAKMLVERAPDNMAKVFFTCGGAESNDNAVLIARAFTGRAKVFSSYRSYHGSTLGSGNLSGDPRRFAVEHPAAAGYIKFLGPYPYRDSFYFANDEAVSAHYIAKLREQLLFEGPRSVAAITLESVVGSNGVIIPPKGYLQGVRKLCDEFGILLHLDEVMAGFGRTGKTFAFENFDVKPDLITFAKGVNCGYVPLGGVIVSKDIAAFYDDHPLLCGYTYNGHALACAAGVTTLEYYDRHNINEHVREVGVVLSKGLRAFAETHPIVGEGRSIGLFGALELVKDKKTGEPLVPYGSDPSGIIPKILSRLRERGFATFGRENTIMVAPPLIITAEQLEEALDILNEVLGWADDNLL